MESRWFVYIIKPSQAQVAIRGIEEQGFGTFNPLCVTAAGIRPLFNGYLFVRFVMQDQPNNHGKHWQGIANTRGVVRAVALEASGIPGAVRVGVVEMLMERMAADGGAIVLAPDPEPDTFKPGETVRITEGPFTSFSGLVQADEGARVRVLLDLFGRPVSYPLQRESIARG